jgi:hypothetical protein
MTRDISRLYVRQLVPITSADRARRRVLAHLSGTACALLARIVHASDHASERHRKLRVRIDAGNATSTLAEFVRQTGLQLLFDADAISHCTTHAVDGHFEAVEVLRRMLEGTGLTFEFINDRTISIRPDPAGPAPVADASNPQVTPAPTR